MIYQHIYHACSQVSNDDNSDKILFDPFLYSHMSPFIDCLDDIEFNEVLISSTDFKAVFITHTHLDHYDLKSLAKLKKSTPVYIYTPKSKYIDYVLRLGFTDVTALKIDDSIKVGKLTVSCLPNTNDQLECAYHITDGVDSVINVADIFFDKESVDTIVQKYGAPDLLVFPFQVLREHSLSLDPPSNLNEEEFYYNEKFKIISYFSPKIVIPGSCQFKFSNELWKNKIYYYNGREQFTLDLKQKLPNIKSQLALSGERFQIHKGSLTKLTQEDSQCLVKTKAVYDYSFDFNQTIPKLSSLNEVGDVSFERSHIEKIISFDLKTFLFLYQVKNPKFKSLFEEEIIWRLTLIYSHDLIVHYDFNLSKKTISQHSDDSIFCDMQTEIIAKALLKTMAGDLSVVDITRHGSMRIHFFSNNPVLVSQERSNLFSLFLAYTYFDQFFEKTLFDLSN